MVIEANGHWILDRYGAVAHRGGTGCPWARFMLKEDETLGACFEVSCGNSMIESDVGIGWRWIPLSISVSLGP
jgi:hypothetical protein